MKFTNSIIGCLICFPMKINQEFKKSSQQKIVVANFKKCRGTLGADSRCRCVALPYVPEYEDDYEAEREKGPVQGVVQGVHFDPKSAESLKNISNFTVKRLERRLNKSIKSAIAYSKKRGDFEAEYDEISAFVYSDRRRNEKAKNNKGEKPKFDKENEMAEILVQNGHAVTFLHELKIPGEKDPDSFVDGFLTEFKKAKPSQIEHRINDGLEQAPNVYLLIDGYMKRDKFYDVIRKVVRNIRKVDPKKSNNPERTESIKKNLVGATLFVSINKEFFRTLLDDIK